MNVWPKLLLQCDKYLLRSDLWRGGLASATVLLALILCLPSCVAAQSQSLLVDQGAQSMSGVTDVLGGQKYLLQNTDLQLLQVNLQNNVLNTQTVDLFTSNSNIVPQGSYVSFSQSVAPEPFDFGYGVVASEASGRVFDSTTDTVAIIAPVGSYFRLTFLDHFSGWNTAVSLTSVFPPSGNVSVNVAMGNFTTSGYASTLAMYMSHTDPGYSWGMRVVTATDPTNESALVTMGPEFVGNSSGLQFAPNASAIAVGDFNNDGLDEIAMLMKDGQTINFYSVNPQSLAITQIGTYQLPDALNANLTMVAGRFRDCGANCQTNADLAVVGTLANSTDPNIVSVIPVQITPQSNGTFTAQAMTQSGSTPYFQFLKPADGVVGNLMAHAAPIVNWPRPTLEQLVIGIPLTGISSGNPWGQIEIGTFLSSGGSTAVLGQFSWESQTPLLQDHGLFFDMQVGNFDNQNSDGTHNPAFQVATYTAEGHDRAPHVRIYDVNVSVPFPPPPPSPNQAPGDWLASQSDYAPSNGVVVDGFKGQQLGILLPADLQSRSLQLGPPTVVTITSQVQPDLVLGIPPMHVAWVAPHIDISQLDEPQCTDPDTPCALNLTVLPSQPPAVSSSGFATGFSFSSNSKTETKQSSTTSWGISVLVKSGLNYSWGNSLAGGSVGFQSATKYTHDHSVKKTFDTYSGKTTNVNATTGFSDYVFYSQKRMNIYYYPVIAQTDCSSGVCSPQYVEFSVPDSVQHAAMNGNTLWWYQPVHQPGNVLSYPLDTTQLQQAYPDTIVPLTADPPTCLGIGTTDTNYSTTWTSGSSGGTTTGNANAFSQNLTFSFSDHAGVKGISSGKFNLSVSLGGNGSFSSLNENFASLSSSQGTSVTEPSFNSAITTCCGYGWGNLVFGLKNTVSPSAQTPVDLVTDPDGNPVPATNATTGPMFVGFLADVLTNKPGGLSGCGVSFPWWTNVYTQPDVALNHPSHWSWHTNTETATFNDPTNPQEVNVLSQPFYEMKGFFISKQGEPAPAPNMPSATAGDQLNLTARVYNYSLVDTTAPVQVRIYGQLYCTATGMLCGNAFEIGQTTIASIPGFKSDSSGAGSYLPNWTTATVPFDTTNYSGDSMVFWVVVWMQDSAGNLVAEMPDKGLTAIPGSNIANISDVPFQAHSNNVGLYGDYHQFYIAPQTTPGATETSGALDSAAIVTASQNILNQRTPVSISVKAGQGAPVDGVNVAYYDGNPMSGGALLNVQRITHIEPGAIYALHDQFLPTTCGAHTLYATAWLDGQPQVQASSPANVTANAIDLVQSLIAATSRAAMSDAQFQQGLLTQLNQALSLFQNGQTAVGDQILGTYLQEITDATGQTVSKRDVGLLTAQTGDLLGCGPLGFALTASPFSTTVSRGGSAQYSIALTPTGDFRGPVQVSCSGAPTNGGCSVSEQTVTLDGVTQEHFTLTVSTGGSSGSVSVAGIAVKAPRSGVPLFEWLLMLAFGLLPIAFLDRSRRKYASWLCMLLIASVGGIVGCASHASSSSATTPPGSYVVFVHATSGNVTQIATMMLYVK